MTDKRIIVQFTLLTFCIAYLVSGILIVLGHFGYTVYSSVQSLQQFGMNIPFAIYILSPTIASYIVLKKNKEIADLREWLKTVFYAKNKILLYVFVVTTLALYFLTHLVVSNRTGTILPFYMLFLALPGNLFIGGLEEAGWMYVLQPKLDKAYGFILSSIATGGIWILWHIPLFFIPGTSHYEGLIDFWMFAVQLMAFRFLYGVIYRMAGKGHVFMCVLCHTVFNAISSVIVILPMTWAGTITASSVIILVSIASVVIYNKTNKSVSMISQSKYK